VLKINANDLSTMASASIEGRTVFGAPNSVAVLGTGVVAILKNNEAHIFDHSLKPISRANINHYNLITNVRGTHGDGKFFMLGMTQQAGTPTKYSYSLTTARTTGPAVRDVDMLLDLQQGFTGARVPGAPAWVSPTVISLMDLVGPVVAICVEGGVFLIDLNGKKIMEVRLEGTGRQEAVAIDFQAAAVYCAHSVPNASGLMISRINSANLSEKRTVTLPGTVTHMVTDPNPVASPNLFYNRTRAVSLAVTPQALFVSHERKIFMLDKNKLTQLQTITVDLPCRLIQVRYGRLPATPTPEGHVGPRDCHLIWAIGSTYIGAGVELKNYRLKLYKLAVL
jgi:hypothetical protein